MALMLIRQPDAFSSKRCGIDSPVRVLYRHHLIERMLNEVFGLEWYRSTMKRSNWSMPSPKASRHG